MAHGIYQSCSSCMLIRSTSPTISYEFFNNYQLKVFIIQKEFKVLKTAMAVDGVQERFQKTNVWHQYWASITGISIQMNILNLKLKVMNWKLKSF